MCLLEEEPRLLQGLCYAVFGLGDRRYREFNYAARKLHARLQTLGAQPFVRLGLGDDQHDFGAGLRRALLSYCMLLLSYNYDELLRYGAGACNTAGLKVKNMPRILGVKACGRP